MRKTKRNRLAALSKAVLCVALCASLAPSAAFGEVRKGDLIGGETVELRGMPASSAPAIAANHSILVDDEGNVYFERAADERVQIASITKIMTATVALESGDLDQQIEVSERAGGTGESTANLVAGDTMTLKEALVGLMVPSGNDAAVAIAENLGEAFVEEAKAAGEDIADADGNPVDLDADDAAYDAFVARMNERARELGCNDTRFANPHGLDFDEWGNEDMYSTARDVATMAAHAIKDETFRGIVSMDGATMRLQRNGAPKDNVLKSTDELLGVYDGACGIKTGTTDKAGPCFAGACLGEGRYLFAVVLDSTSNEQRFEDARSLYEWVRASEFDYALANSDQTTTMELDGVTSEVPVFGYAALSTWADRTVPVTLANPQASVNVSSIFGNVSQSATFEEIPGGVRAGDVVGHVDFYQNNEVVASQDLVACENVDDPNILDFLASGFRDVVGFFTGGTEEAESVVLNQTPLLLGKN